MKRNIRPKNDKGQAHGLWVSYWDNGNIHSKSTWVNDKRNGIWIAFNMRGKLMHKWFFI